jgi:hypothetical protein
MSQLISRFLHYVILCGLFVFVLVSLEFLFEVET